MPPPPPQNDTVRRESVCVVPGHSTEQSAVAYPDLHSQDRPSGEHWPCPEHGLREPPGHSTSQIWRCAGEAWVTGGRGTWSGPEYKGWGTGWRMEGGMPTAGPCFACAMAMGWTRRQRCIGPVALRRGRICKRRSRTRFQKLRKQRLLLRCEGHCSRKGPQCVRFASPQLAPTAPATGVFVAPSSVCQMLFSVSAFSQREGG